MERAPPACRNWMTAVFLDLPAASGRNVDRRGGPRILFHVAEEPLQQVQSVDRLVDQHSAAALGPGAAPGPAPVVGLVAEPGDRWPVPPRTLPRVPRLPVDEFFAVRLRGVVVSVLEAHRDRRPALCSGRRLGPPASPSETVVATTAFSSVHVHRGLQTCLDSHRRVQVVRRTDVQHVGAGRREHHREVGVGRAAELRRRPSRQVRADMVDPHRTATSSASGIGPDGVEMDGSDVAATDHRDAQRSHGHAGLPSVPPGSSGR